MQFIKWKYHEEFQVFNIETREKVGLCMALLGLDVGSTGCKVILFSDNGKPLKYAYREYSPSDCIYEIDGEIIWSSVKLVLMECTVGCNEVIRGIGISSFGESFVPVDKAGKVLFKTMLYTDPHGMEQCRDYCSKVGEDFIMKTTGIKPHSMYSLSKIGYLHDEHRKIFECVHKFLLIESFCIYRLTGEYAIDYSLAARTMAFDITKKTWSKELLALAHIDETKMAKAVPSGTEVGTILPAIAFELGLNQNIKVITGGHDQVCAAVGAGITKPGLAIDGTGTVECITPVFDRPILSSDFLNNNYACVPHPIDGMYVTYAFNFTGGAILKWYRDNFAKYEIEAAAKKGIGVYAMLDSLGAKEPTDVIIVPHFAGSATPDMNEAARGAFFGLRFDTDAATLYRSLIEGVTYEMAYNMEVLRLAGIEIKELRAVGGGAKSSYWLSIKADIMGCNIVSLDVEEAGITGAAMLAGTACGLYKNLDDAADNFVRIKSVTEPNFKNHKIYADNYKRYKQARQMISNLYKNT